MEPRPSTARTRGNKDYRFGYVAPPPPQQLTSEQRRALRYKTFQQRLQEINDAFEAKDQQLDAVRYRYVKLIKQSEEIKQKIVAESDEAEKTAKEMRDPSKATKDALATSQRTLALIRRLRAQAKPRMYIDRKPDVLDSSSKAGSRPSTARLTPRRGYSPPQEEEEDDLNLR